MIMKPQELPVACGPIFRTGAAAAVGPAVQDNDQRLSATAGALTEEDGVVAHQPTGSPAGAASAHPCLRPTSHNQRRRNVMPWMKQALLHGLQAGFLLAVLGGSALALEPKNIVEEEGTVEEESTIEEEGTIEEKAACVRSPCSITVGGRKGYYSCVDGYSALFYDSRYHVFVTGCDGYIYYIYQTQRGGTTYSGWHGLGGPAQGSPQLRVRNRVLYLEVEGVNDAETFAEYCKRYVAGVGWLPWTRCP
jgi:hypothetical protein